MLKKVIKKFKSYSLSKKISEISQRIKQKNLTYLSCEKIINLEECLQDLKQNSVSGIFLEAGIALGGSAIIIASLMPEDANFRGYDVFEMIPPPSNEDDAKSKARYEIIKNGESKGIDGKDIYYGYIENLYEQVVKNFESLGLRVDDKKVSLYKGLFENTMHFTSTDTIAFAHIDCDWYEPVRLCLERIYPVLSIKGYLVLDDYHDYGGCQKAVDEFLTTHQDIVIVKSEPNLVLQRIST
jgi:asparagine synthase (glutamine-hydrolysing)